MSDKQAAEIAKAAEAIAAAPVTPAPANSASSSNGLTTIALLLAFVALGAVGYLYLQQQSQFVQLQNKLDENKQSLVAKTEQVSDLADTQDKAQQQTQQQLAEQLQALAAELRPKLTAQQQTIEQQKNRLEQLSEVDRSDWQLAEADYLLQLASQRVLLMRDTSGVAEILQSVDKIVADLNNTDLLDVRKILAEEITAIKTTPAIDLQGMYLRIAAIEKQANTLPIVLPTNDVFEVEKDADAVKPSTWMDNFFSGLNQALNKLGAYVRVQHRDMPLPPTLAPEQENLVRRSLQLQFEQAQFALLAGNQTLYVASLEKARSWLFDLYLANRAATQQVITEIDEMIKQPVAQVLPELGAAHQALQKHIEARHSRVNNSAVVIKPIQKIQPKKVEPKEAELKEVEKAQ
jgi:uroporphyrin-3 C-methyltransferase